jgi:DNA-binding PadR family transcriptional regulator
MFDLIMLATLFEGPKHGYQIKREAGFILGEENLHNNLVYPLLKKFAAEGWVVKKAMPGERGQTRQQYAITALGKATLIRRLNEFDEIEAKSFDAFIVRVGMFELLATSDRERIMTAREEHLQRRSHALEGLQGKMDVGLYGGEVVDFLKEDIQSELGWIRRMRRLAPLEE